jgi:hypothetical protein
MYIYGERLMSDVLAGHLGVWLGYFSRPIFTEAEFLGALQIRGFNNIVTKKMNSILFFSGRKCAAARVDPEWHTPQNAEVSSDSLKY